MNSQQRETNHVVVVPPVLSNTNHTSKNDIYSPNRTSQDIKQVGTHQKVALRGLQPLVNESYRERVMTQKNKTRVRNVPEFGSANRYARGGGTRMDGRASGQTTTRKSVGNLGCPPLNRGLSVNFDGLDKQNIQDVVVSEYIQENQNGKSIDKGSFNNRNATSHHKNDGEVTNETYKIDFNAHHSQSAAGESYSHANFFAKFQSNTADSHYLGSAKHQQEAGLKISSETKDNFGALASHTMAFKKQIPRPSAERRYYQQMLSNKNEEQIHNRLMDKNKGKKETPIIFQSNKTSIVHEKLIQSRRKHESNNNEVCQSNDTFQDLFSNHNMQRTLGNNFDIQKMFTSQKRLEQKQEIDNQMHLLHKSIMMKTTSGSKICKTALPLNQVRVNQIGKRIDMIRNMTGRRQMRNFINNQIKREKEARLVSEKNSLRVNKALGTQDMAQGQASSISQDPSVINSSQNQLQNKFVNSCLQSSHDLEYSEEGSLERKVIQNIHRTKIDKRDLTLKKGMSIYHQTSSPLIQKKDSCEEDASNSIVSGENNAHANIIMIKENERQFANTGVGFPQTQKIKVHSLLQKSQKYRTNAFPKRLNDKQARQSQILNKSGENSQKSPENYLSDKIPLPTQFASKQLISKSRRQLQGNPKGGVDLSKQDKVSDSRNFKLIDNEELEGSMPPAGGVLSFWNKSFSDKYNMRNNSFVTPNDKSKSKIDNHVLIASKSKSSISPSDLDLISRAKDKEEIQQMVRKRKSSFLEQNHPLKHIFMETVIDKINPIERKLVQIVHGSSYGHWDFKYQDKSKKSENNFYKREYKNCQQKSLSKYDKENQMVREVLMRTQNADRERLEYLSNCGSRNQASNQKNLSSSLDSTNLKLKQKVGAIHPARVFTHRERTSEYDMNYSKEMKMISIDEAREDQSEILLSAAESKGYLEQDQMPCNDAQEKNLVDKKTGLFLHPVSSNVFEIEDLMFNSQFQKKGSVNPETLIEQFLKLKNQAKLKQRIKSSFKTQRTSKQPHQDINLDNLTQPKLSESTQFQNTFRKFQGSGQISCKNKQSSQQQLEQMFPKISFLSPRVAPLCNIEYKFKHRIDPSTRSRKRNILQSFQKVNLLSSDSTTSPAMRSNKKQNNEQIRQQDYYHSEREKLHKNSSQNSSLDRNKNKSINRLLFKHENDHLFVKDKYLIQVQHKDKEEVKKYIEDLDRRIMERKEMGGRDKEISEMVVKTGAEELYHIIKGKDYVPFDDKEKQQFFLDVYKSHREDPDRLEKCCLKKIQKNLLDFWKRKQPNDRSLKVLRHPRNFVICNHQFSDDVNLLQRAKYQKWFLSFCKFLCVLVLQNEIQIEELQVMTNWEEWEVEDSKARVKEWRQKIDTIQELSKQVLERPKPSYKKEAITAILQNLSRFIEELNPTEREVLKDYASVHRLLNDPILKLLVKERPDEVLKLQLHKSDQPGKFQSSYVMFDDCKNIFIKELAHTVLKEFKDNVITLRKRNFATFQNQEDKDKIPENEDEHVKNTFESLQALDDIDCETMTVGAEPNPMMDELDQCVENVSPVKEKRMVVQKLTSKLSTNEYACQQMMLLTERDILKRIVNIHLERQHQRRIKQHETGVKTMVATNIGQKFLDVRKSIIQRKSTKSLISKQEKQTAEDKLKEMTRELSKAMSLKLKIDLYQFFVKHKDKKKEHVYDDQDTTFQFFNKAKQLVQGSDDAHEGNEIQYYKDCRSQMILEIPILFKHLKNNEIFFKGTLISKERAIAIKNILQEACQVKNEQNPYSNPFIIKSLIIDDCGMQDDVFEQILLGLIEQEHLRHIHYTNRNRLGVKSAALLSQILSRNNINNFIKELNLSNTIIERPAKGNMALLVGLTQDIENVCKVQRLKLSHINLNDPEIIRNLLDILQSNYNMNYFSVAYCNIQLPDLTQIIGEFSKCHKLEYINCSGNKITKNFKGEEQQERRVAELVEQISDAIESQTSQLRFLDISDIGIQGKHLRKILLAIQKNNKLESINLGHIDQIDDVKTITKMLDIVQMDHTISLADLGKSEQSLQFGLEDLMITSGMAKNNARQRSKRESQFVSMSDPQASQSPYNQIFLNRFCRNPELVFNPNCPHNCIDHQRDRKWHVVKNCFISNRHRYVLVYYNQEDPRKNQFNKIDDQDQLMDKLDKLYEWRQEGPPPPLVFVDGKFHQMIDPVIYSCFLQIPDILSEIQTQLSGPHGAVEVTRLNTNKLTPQNIASQQKVDDILRQMSENSIRHHFANMANDLITQQTLESMTVLQQQIFSDFANTAWHAVIDEKILNMNPDYTQVVNYQQFQFNEWLADDVEYLRMRKQQQSATHVAEPAADNLTDSKSVAQANQVNNTAGRAHDTCNDSLNQDRSDDYYAPLIYLFATYMSPGRHSIYIYDRVNHEILHRDILVDMPGDHTPTLAYSPAAPNQDELDMLDARFEEMEQNYMKIEANEKDNQAQDLAKSKAK